MQKKKKKKAGHYSSRIVFDVKEVFMLYSENIQYHICTGHHALGPRGSVWVPEPNSSWQPLANQHQATWASGPNQGTQNQTQQRFALAPSVPHLADLPPSYDEAVMGKAQGPGLQYSHRP